MNKYFVIATALICLTPAACDSPDVTRQVQPDSAPLQTRVPVIYTVNYPLAWMTEQIAGDLAEVIFPLPAGIDPAHWQPAAEDILLYQQADRVLLNGAGYASWIGFAALSPGRLMDTTAGASERFVSLGAMTHTHGPAGTHEHGDVASHTWLDPTLAMSQAQVIADTLTELLPDEKKTISDNVSKLEIKFNALDAELAAAFSGWSELGVLFSHPVYQYLDARFALNGRSLTLEPDQPPSADEWQKLTSLIAQRPATVMLWEAEPSAETASRLSGLGITPIVFEVSGNRPEAGDYLLAMQANLKRLQSFR